MKERLVSALGFFGLILYYCITALYVIIPVFETGWPIWLVILALAIMIFTNYIGACLSIVVYTVSFINMIHEPFSVFTVIYIVCLLIWIMFQLIPSIINIIEIARKKDGE